MIYRTLRLVVGLAMTLTALVAWAPNASAAFSNTPDPTWMTNGEVRAVVRAGNYVYIGGSFTKVRSMPPGTPGPSYDSVGIARLDAATGTGDSSWTAQVTRSDGEKARVYAIAVAAGRVWIGGKFDLVNGVPHLNFAALSESTGELDPTVTAAVGTGLTQFVEALEATGTTLYAGGKFSTVDGNRRTNLAAFDLAGALMDWRPKAFSPVRTLALDCEGGTILAGGGFEEAAGQGGARVTREKVARFDVSTGVMTPWAIPPADLPNGIWITDLALSCQSSPPRLYGGGGGQNFLYAFDFSSDDTGQKLFERQTSGNVQAVAINDQGTADVADDRVLFGGHFGGGVTYPAGTCSVSKPKTARFGVADLNGNCDLSWWPSFQGKFWGIWDILVTDNGDHVWIGGDYTQVCSQDTSNCVTQAYLSRFTDV